MTNFIKRFMKNLSEGISNYLDYPYLSDGISNNLDYPYLSEGISNYLDYPYLSDDDEYLYSTNVVNHTYTHPQTNIDCYISSDESDSNNNPVLRVFVEESNPTESDNNSDNNSDNEL